MESVLTCPSCSRADPSPAPPGPGAALSWLRRRGPPLPESALHKLFRQQTVRLYDPATQRVGRVSKGRHLPPGATLLLPRAALADAATGRAGGGQPGAALQVGKSGPAGSPERALAGRQAQAWLVQLRGSLLHRGPDFLAINKPAGLACQGGSGLALSLDSLMGEAFGGVPGVQAGQLRLVHRLDKQTTGAGRGWAWCRKGEARTIPLAACSMHEHLLGFEKVWISLSCPELDEPCLAAGPPCHATPTPPILASNIPPTLLDPRRRAARCTEPRCGGLAGSSLQAGQPGQRRQQQQQRRRRRGRREGGTTGQVAAACSAGQHPQNVLGGGGL